MTSKFILVLIVVAGFLGWIYLSSCKDGLMIGAEHAVSIFDDLDECNSTIADDSCESVDIDNIFRSHLDKCKSHCAPCDSELTYDTKEFKAECIARDDGKIEMVCKGVKTKCDCK